MRGVRQLTSLLLLLFWFQSWAQSPYKKYSSSDNVILGVTALSGLTTMYLEHKMPPLTPKEAATLDRMSINAFDRPATYYLSDRAAGFSDYGLQLSRLRGSENNRFVSCP